jgi:META domain
MDRSPAVRLISLAAAALLVSGCAQASSARTGAPATPSASAGSTSPILPTAPSTSGAPSAAPTTASQAPSPTASAPAPGVRVSSLVGRWAVIAKGEPATTRLILNGTAGLSVYRHCGSIDGSWRAAPQGAFVNSLSGGSQACFDSPRTDLSSLPWLWKAHGFRTVTGGWLLLDANGRELARLTPGDKPYLPPTILASEADPPSLSRAEAAKLDRPPVGLPAGLTTATAESLAGTWLPVDGTRGYLTLTAAGDWHGSDGCNRSSGSWTVLDGGAVLATIGPTTLVLCTGTQVPLDFAGAAAAGFDGKVLDLVDAAGQVTLRLQRGSAPVTP